MGTLGKRWTTPNKKRRSRAERFWQHVTKTADCWLWTASRKTGWGGYGRFVTRHYYKTKEEMAHRVAWELTNGSIPEGLCVLHRCDNPPCVNPDHLFLGTRNENNADRDAKGRHIDWRKND